VDQIEDWLGGIPRLDRVVGLNREAPLPYGGRFILSAAEFWNNMVMFHAVLIDADPRVFGITPGQRVLPTLIDDEGTAYQLVHGGGTGNGRRLFRHTWGFGTPDPLTARCLYLDPPQVDTVFGIVLADE